MEQGAAPAGEARNLALGRPRGSARAALGPLCEELAGRGPGRPPDGTARLTREGRRPNRTGGRTGEPGSAVPGTEKPPVERREACVPIARDAPRLATGVVDRLWRSDPLAFLEGEVAQTRALSFREN